MENKASKVKNLTHQEAIEKFKELVKHESTCLFTTRLTQVPLTSGQWRCSKFAIREIFGS
jgi:hypothetical protein